MGMVLDLMIIAIFILSIALGIRRGLINVAFNVLAFFTSLVITFFILTPATNFVIENTQIDEQIKSAIIDNNLLDISKKDEKDVKDTDKVFNNYVKQYVEDEAESSIDYTARLIAEKIVRIIVAILLFFIVRILLIFVSFIANGLSNLPIIRQFNKLGGFIYGVFCGLFIIYILLTILFFVTSVNNNGIIAQAINSSVIAKYLSAHNFIITLFMK